MQGEYEYGYPGIAGPNDLATAKKWLELAGAVSVDEIR